MIGKFLDPAPRRILNNLYMVGGPDLTDPRDCLCYLVKGSQASVLIDCGAGPSTQRILELAGSVSQQPLTHLCLTHAHIDHAGGAAELKRLTGCQVLMHHRDADTLVLGDPQRSAAHWYGLKLEPIAPDRLLDEGDAIQLGPDQVLHILHTPGHTPGSLCLWCEMDGQRVLFGQDIHGPFSPAFGSDLSQWRVSMQRLLDFKPDILAEGHYGVFRPAGEAEAFIRKQLSIHGK